MMGGDGTGITETRMDELTISAISEAMNQMCGTIATSMATLLDRPTDIGFPLINVEYSETIDVTAVCGPRTLGQVQPFVAEEPTE